MHQGDYGRIDKKVQASSWAIRCEIDSTCGAVRGTIMLMREKGRVFNATVLFVLFNVPGFVKFWLTAFTVTSTPGDAKQFGAAVLEAVKAIASWPWWMALSCTIGSLGLYAVYLFGTNALAKALAIVFRSDARRAFLRSVRHDAEMQKIRCERRAEVVEARKLKDALQTELKDVKKRHSDELVRLKDQQTEKHNEVLETIDHFRRHVVAREILDRGTCFPKLAPPTETISEPPNRDDSADVARYENELNRVTSQLSSIEVGISKILAGPSMGYHFVTSLNSAQRIADAAQRSNDYISDLSENSYWPEDTLKRRWLSIAAQVDELNKIQDEAEARVKSAAAFDSNRLTQALQMWSQLRLDIGSETPQ